MFHHTSSWFAEKAMLLGARHLTRQPRTDRRREMCKWLRSKPLNALLEHTETWALASTPSDDANDPASPLCDLALNPYWSLSVDDSRWETVLDRLIENHATYPQLDSRGMSPLHRVVRDVSESTPEIAVTILKALLRHGSVVDAQDKKGTTPLLDALDMGRHHLVMPLLQAGSDPTILNNRGTSPLIFLDRLAEGTDGLTGECLATMLEVRRHHERRVLNATILDAVIVHSLAVSEEKPRRRL